MKNNNSNDTTKSIFKHFLWSKKHQTFIYLLKTILISIFLNIVITLIIWHSRFGKKLLSNMFETSKCEGFGCLGPVIELFIWYAVIVLFFYIILIIILAKALKRKGMPTMKRIATTTFTFILMILMGFFVFVSCQAI